MTRAATFARRRERVLAALGDDAALILSAAPELRVGHDGELRYVPDAYLYWLTGYTEPEALLVLCPSGPSPFTLFVRPRDEERERWTGPRGGIEAALESFGADAAYPVADCVTRLPGLAGHVTRLFARVDGTRPDLDSLILALLANARRSRPRTGAGPRTLVDPAELLDDMRLIKDAGEIESIRRAAAITADAFRDALPRIAPGCGEWRVEAALEAGFRMRGASGPAFPTIVASGSNATTLHYIENGRQMDAGQLVLLDAGARAEMYCADVSRTLPVSGTFTPEQRDVYDAVLAAHSAAIDAACPGRTIGDVFDAALHVLLDALIALRFTEGPRDALLEAPDRYKRFYPHRASHWLGLDVHDVGDYMMKGTARRLEPGMVLTVEPGLYVLDDTDTGPVSLRGTGIRIEDDVLVTDGSAEVLTGTLPVDADALVALMR